MICMVQSWTTMMMMCHYDVMSLKISHLQDGTILPLSRFASVVAIQMLE